MFLPKATPIRCPKKKQATPLKNTPPSRWSKITENLMEIPTQMPLQHAGLLPHFDHQRLLTSINSYKPLMETHIFHYFPVFFAGLKNHRDQIHPFFQGTPWPRAEGRWQRMPRPFLSASGWDHRSLPASGLWHSQLEKKIPWFQSTNQECQNIISVKSPRFFGLPQVWTAECLLWPHFLGLKIQGLCPQKWTSKLMEISGKLFFFLIYELLLTTIIPIYDSISWNFILMNYY